MSRIFEVDFRQGSLRDRVSGTIPTNLNAIISQREKGRCALMAGNADLSYTTNAALNALTDNFTLVIWGQNTADNARLFSRRNGGSHFELIMLSNVLQFFDGVTLKVGSRIVNDGKYYQLVAKIQGASSQLYINGAADGGTFSTSITGRNTPSRLGSYKGTSSFMSGSLLRVEICDHPWSVLEIAADYQEFLASQHITKPIVIKRGDATNMVVSIDSTNWNADGGTTNRSFGNLEKGSGAFRCLEDATGKYIECTTNGTLKLKGIDLSIFTGNGYLKEVLGDLSGDAGGTVDAASAFAFSGNVLTITMTAGQTLRGFTITASA